MPGTCSRSTDAPSTNSALELRTSVLGCGTPPLALALVQLPQKRRRDSRMFSDASGRSARGGSDDAEELYPRSLV
jgi:hypothetical protein